MFFVDRAWWAWDGWPAVGALAQALAAFATLGTLIFFWVQIRREHAYRQADRDHSLRLLRESFQATNTPVLTVVIRDGQASGEGGSVTFALVAQGSGVVRNIEIDCWVGNTEPQHPLAGIAPPGLAPGYLPRLSLVKSAPALLAPDELEQPHMARMA